MLKCPFDVGVNADLKVIRQSKRKKDAGCVQNTCAKAGIAGSRMDKGSPVQRAGEWRVYWLSGQHPCRSPIGAALRGAVFTVINFLIVSSALAGRNPFWK
jgi:hypothetical protein